VEPKAKPKAEEIKVYSCTIHMLQQYILAQLTEREYNKIKNGKRETLVNTTRTFLGNQV